MASHLHAVQDGSPVTYTAEFLTRLEQQAKLCVGDRFQDPPLILVTEAGAPYSTREYRVLRRAFTDSTLPGQPVIVLEADPVGASATLMRHGWRPT